MNHSHDLIILNFSSPGHLFDLNSLTLERGYTVYDPQEHRKMFRMNICGNVTNAGCAPGTGALFSGVNYLANDV